MARYLSFILDGEMPADQRDRLPRDVTAHVEGGRTFVTVRGLHDSALEEVLRAIGASGLRREDGYYDLGPMPRHKDDPEDDVVAYVLDADFTDRPANQDSDFEQPVPDFKGFAFLLPGKTLQVMTKPRGHVAQVGVHQIADEGLMELLIAFAPDLETGKVSWKGKPLPWCHLVDAQHVVVLDSQSFNPTRKSPVGGLPVIPLRLPLVAAPGKHLTGDRMVRNARSRMLHGRQPIFLLSPAAAEQVRSRFSKGYVLQPVYGNDSPTAHYARSVGKLLDRYIPPVANSRRGGSSRKDAAPGEKRSRGG